MDSGFRRNDGGQHQLNRAGRAVDGSIVLQQLGHGTTGADVVALVKAIQADVQARYGVLLEPVLV